MCLRFANLPVSPFTLFNLYSIGFDFLRGPGRSSPERIKRVVNPAYSLASSAPVNNWRRRTGLVVGKWQW